MSSPKHLWSGDWERESAAAAAARQDANAVAPSEPVELPAPAPPPPAAPPPRAAPRQTPSWLQRRVLLLAVVGAVVLVGAAWAISSSGGGPSATAAGPLPYLGLQLESVPVNRVIVQAVVPGSPADQAGIGAGDLLLSVNGHQVSSPGDVDRILAQLHPGDSVKLLLEQGPLAITAQVQLAQQPAGTP